MELEFHQLSLQSKKEDAWCSHFPEVKPHTCQLQSKRNESKAERIRQVNTLEHSFHITGLTVLFYLRFLHMKEFQFLHQIQNPHALLPEIRDGMGQHALFSDKLMSHVVGSVLSREHLRAIQWVWSVFKGTADPLRGIRPQAVSMRQKSGRRPRADPTMWCQVGGWPKW